MNNDLKKGLSYIAIGFLFTLVNFNLIINSTRINIMPDFIGWILLFLAYDKMGDYLKGKAFLKWVSFLLAIATLGLWIASLIKTSLNIDLYTGILNIVAAVYMFILFGGLRRVALDMGSNKAGMLTVLRYVNFALFFLLSLLQIFATRIDIELLKTCLLVLGSSAIAAAAFTAVVLFLLSKEMNEMP